MRRILKGVCVGLALWLAASVQARVPESPHLRLLGVREGLPSTHLNVIDLDRAGFVWIGSADGLARHDGHGFRIWRHDPRDPRSLPGNNVQALHVDGRDRIWVATEFGGVGMLDAQRSRFAILRRETHPAFASNDVFAIASRGDELWFGTSSAGLYRLDARSDLPALWRPEAIPGLPAQTVLSLAFDGEGRLWIGTTRGLAYWDGRRVVPQPLPDVATAGMVYALLSEGGRLWVGSADGLFRRDRQGQWQRLPYSPMFERPNAVVAMARAADGTMWLGSQRRLWRVAADDAIPLPVLPDGSATPRYVSALRMQADGGLWTAVPGKGLGFLRPDWRSVAELGQRGDGSGLAAEIYRATGRARAGGLWVAGNDGHIERIAVGGRIAYCDVRQHADLQGLKPVAMHEDAAGGIWLGDVRQGLIRVECNGRLQRWHRQSAEDPLPAQGFVDLIASGNGNSIWLSLQGFGLQQRQLGSGRILREIAASAENGLGDGDSEAIALGPDGRLWIAGGNGLGWLDEMAGRKVLPEGLAGERVFAFAFAGEDMLWLHRLKGLEQYRRRGMQWHKVAEVLAGRELPAVESAGLVLDRQGRVWLSSQRGLFRWDPQRQHLRAYGMANGFSSQEFIDRALVLSDEGLLATPTNAGTVVLVDTRYPEPAAKVPVLGIDAVDVRQNGEWVSRLQEGTEVLRFGPEDRELRFRGHLLVFDDPAAARYWSRLQGFDSDWVDQGAQGERIFTGLPPGRYVLHMRARDAAGNMAPEQSLAFVVLPPWWLSHWALATAALAFLLLLWLLVRGWRRRLRRRHEWQLAEQRRQLAEQASAAKTRFLATLGHEIRTPLTGVLGMAELLQQGDLDSKQQRQVAAIHGAGKHLLHLVNDALDLARIEAGKLPLVSAAFDLPELIEETATLLRPLAQGKGLDFHLQIAAGTPHRLRGDRTRVGQILLNLLGNAIKFTERGEVSLQALPATPGVMFVIRDTGPGFAQEKAEQLFRRFEQGDAPQAGSHYGGSGLGLAISRELAGLMGGQVEVESAPGKGAVFHVHLPLPLAEVGQAQASPVPASPVAGLRLLLVEDDPLVAEVIMALLTAQGHTVRHAAHALAALVESREHVFDVLLLDLNLPGMGGLALAEQLRRSGCDRPLVAITASADTRAEADALAAGFDFFLRKPVTGEMLATVLAEAVRRG